MSPFLSVRFRLFALCAGLLVVLGGANVLLGEINLEHESEVRLQQEQYRRVQVINGVLQAMSTYRYWWGQHNAAVMVKNPNAELQAREKRGAAQVRLEERLGELHKFDQPTVATVSDTIKEFPGHLQLGIRALLRREPGAEDHLNKATRLLTAAENVLASAAQREELLAERTQRQARDRAAFRMRLSVLVIAFSAGFGLLLTYLVLRSIVQPMQSTVKALRLVNAGETAIDLPPVSQDEFGDMALALRQFRDQAERLRRLAYRDSLTGAGNRTRLEEALVGGIERSRQNGNRLALFYIDLDNFRTVNDSLGHSVGDRYLCEAVARLQRFAPDDALVCRYGGDKFTVLLSDLPASDLAATHSHLRRVAENILQGMAEPYQQGNDLLPMSVSIGIAIFPNDGQSGEQLVSSADAAMYLAKRQGRNNAQFATPELTGDARKQLAIVSDIRRGLESGEFEPFYQPIVDIVARRVVGAEALLRWRHPQRGIVSAGEFIPAAEATGLIHALSETCMVKACDQAKRWRNGNLRISVNLSARQIEDRTVIPLLERLHSGAVSGAPSLDFEITETAILRQIDRAEETLAQVRALGHALSLDDFGTGYSSLVYLQRFPINRIKIDRSFVARVETSREARAIISATVALARSLDLDVVAEGVETGSQLRELHALGCILQQGYYFTPALPSAEFDAWRFVESVGDAAHTATA